MLAAFIAFLIAMGATALFNYCYPIWIMWMYGVSGNIIVNIKGDIGRISDGAKTYSKIDDNFIYRMGRGKKLFNDFENGDYALKNAPDGFEQIPLDKIGRY